MKNVLYLIIPVFLLTILTTQIKGQAPDGVNYQAVVRNSLGLPLNTQFVSVRFTIHQSSPTGTTVFQEVHATTTNQFGLINLELGSVNNGAFSVINWGTGGAYYLQIEVDAGAGYDDLGASQLLSVPYALFAKTAATGAQGFNSLIDTVAATSLACPTGGFQVLMGLDTNANTVLDAGEITSSFVVCNGSSGAAIISDTSATNEIQTLSISNDTIFLTSGGFVILPNLGADNDWIINAPNMSSGVAGNVGIGTTTPTRKLSIESPAPGSDGIQINNTSVTGNPGIEFQTQSTTRYVMGIDQSDNNKFKIGTTGVNVNTRFTINNQGLVGIGNINPSQQLSVFSQDTVIASFVGSNADASIISISGINPNAAVGSVYLTGSDSGIVAIDPLQKTFFISNTTTDGHIALTGDSSAAMYGQVVGLIASNKIINQADTIFSVSTTSNNIINVNKGTFITDSLYKLGTNSFNANWVLANDGFGQAVWTNPSLLGGSSLWQSNAPDVYFNTGNVGIGTINPLSALQVHANSTGNVARIQNNSVGGYSSIDYHDNIGNQMGAMGYANASSTNHSSSLYLMGTDASTPVILGTQDTERLRVATNGNIGIGTSIPSYNLDVVGETKTDSLVITGGAGNGLILTSDAAGNASWQTPAVAASAWIDGGANIYPTTLTDNIAIGVVTATNTKFQIDNSFEESTAVFNSWNSGPATVYGINSSVVSTSLNQYGVYSIVNNLAPGAFKYGSYTAVGGTGNTHYGIYSEVSGATTNWSAFFADGNVYVADTMVIPTNAGAGKILTSDAAGNATWQVPGATVSPWTQTGADIYQTTLTNFVGIGTTAPTEMLSVGSLGTATGVGTQQSSHKMALTGSFWNAGAVAHDFVLSNEASTVTAEEGRLAIGWSGSGTELMTIESKGYIGMGITNPSSQLHIVDNVNLTPEILLETSAGNFNIGYRYRTALSEWFMGQGNATGQQFRIADVTAGTIPFVIEQTNGFVGIGDIAPSSLLHIRDDNIDINASQLTIEADKSFGAQSFAAIEFRANASGANVGPTGRIRSYYVNAGITSATTTFQTVGLGPTFVDVMSLTDGKVGIGTSIPFALLEVNAGDFALSFGHFISRGGIPAAGSGSVTGTDVAGTVDMFIAALPQTEMITFNTPYTNVPTVTLTPANLDAAQSEYYVNSSTTGFTIIINNITGGANPIFNYMVIGN